MAFRARFRLGIRSVSGSACVRIRLMKTITKRTRPACLKPGLRSVYLYEGESSAPCAGDDTEADGLR